MATKTSKKEKKQEELVPLQCYACKLYDGKFGPESQIHTHVCDSCKKLPTDNRVIERHTEEYLKDQASYGEETLGCEECGLERDQCMCPDNQVRREQLDRIARNLDETYKTDLELEVEKEEMILEKQEKVQRLLSMTYNFDIGPVRPDPFRYVAPRPAQHPNPNVQPIEPTPLQVEEFRQRLIESVEREVEHGKVEHPDPEEDF